ncbi:hypothetical protein SAMN02745857_03119 [Andreprevotia lacus DSM 23236]|jgi:hypothetical protein|uniref:Transmembrane protein n=1 Tax=Andreprevotia lacus DSM 23236 TaxID=1121001 RepID=A0A1W1XW66_9NEIS|nr:hypothetical protein [Andreprevotia lacus]SMC28102.1 hypothetical protein SAMN02745857_03119 [Andreprevotia lacus DSM 23236]
MKTLLLVFMLVISAACFSAPISNWEKQKTSHAQIRKGAYINQHYGLVVQQVPGIRMYVDKPPAPNHGALFIIAEKRMMDVFVSAEDPDTDSAAQVVDQLLAVPGTRLIGKREPARLGNVPADQVAYLTAEGEPRRSVVYFDKTAQLSYTATLYSDVAHFAEDASVFAALLQRITIAHRD